MPTTAASAHTPLRRRFGIPLCAVFVGSSLVALAAPVHAEPTPSPSSSTEPSPSASPSPSSTPTAPAPTPSATVAFARSADRVRLGSSVEPNLVTATNTGDAAICLVGLTVEIREFTVEGFSAQLLDPGHKADIGQVTGSPRRDTDVVATLAYALADPETGCSAIDSESAVTTPTGTWSVAVHHTEPSLTPTPTPAPTPPPDPPAGSERPTSSPTEPPTGGSNDTDDSKTSSPTPITPTTPSSPDTPRSPSSSNSSNDSTSNGSNSGSGSGSTPTSRSGVDDVPTSDADIPTLPRDEADLPGISGGSEDLAELPLVTPSSDDDAGQGGAEVAADASDLGPNWAPAVLLAALLLALLLATPLAPARRVRVASGYQGKRRKG